MYNVESPGSLESPVINSHGNSEQIPPKTSENRSFGEQREPLHGWKPAGDLICLSGSENQATAPFSFPASTPFFLTCRLHPDRFEFGSVHVTWFRSSIAWFRLLLV